MSIGSPSPTSSRRGRARRVLLAAFWCALAFEVLYACVGDDLLVENLGSVGASLYGTGVNGTECTADTDCIGFCIPAELADGTRDGTKKVCCDTACGGGVQTDCQYCRVGGGMGICTPVVADSVCRPEDASGCDVEEKCDGVATTCPVDAVVPDDPPVACAPTSVNMCRTNYACVLGACDGDPVDCDDANPCTTDTCEPSTGCSHAPISGCAPDAGPGSDAGTDAGRDAGPGADSGPPVTDSGVATDSGAPGDAGARDSGGPVALDSGAAVDSGPARDATSGVDAMIPPPPPAPEPDCSCRVAPGVATSDSSSAALLLMALGPLALLWRRRRRS